MTAPVDTPKPISGSPDDPRMVRARELLQPFVNLTDADLVVMKHQPDTVICLMRALFDALDVHPAQPFDGDRP